jgi:hypothetical protein
MQPKNATMRAPRGPSGLAGRIFRSTTAYFMMLFSAARLRLAVFAAASFPFCFLLMRSRMARARTAPVSGSASSAIGMVADSSHWITGAMSPGGSVVPARQQRELVRMADTGEYTTADLAEVFIVSRATVYRTLQRSPAADAAR